jgi:hypothetical protein
LTCILASNIFPLFAVRAIEHCIICLILCIWTPYDLKHILFTFCCKQVGLTIFYRDVCIIFKSYWSIWYFVIPCFGYFKSLDFITVIMYLQVEMDLGRERAAARCSVKQFLFWWSHVATTKVRHWHFKVGFSLVHGFLFSCDCNEYNILIFSCSNACISLIVWNVMLTFFTLYAIPISKHTSLDNYMQDQSLYAHYGISGKMVKLSFQLFLFVIRKKICFYLYSSKDADENDMVAWVC